MVSSALKDSLEIDSKTLLDLMRYAFLRLDGAWFMAAAEKFGVEAATELDIKTWETFSERLGKKIVSIANLKGEISQELSTILKIQHKLMNMNGEVTIQGKNKVMLRISDCEVWKMVSKVWTSETAPCYKVTQASIRGLLKGAFPKTEFVINHNKKIPLGDSCCEVEIIIKNAE